MKLWPSILLIAVMILVRPLLAQDEAPAPRHGAEVPDLEIRVDDLKGRPVTGLRRGDFELTIDGRPAGVSEFLAVGGPGRPAEPLTLAVFVDNLHVGQFSRNRALAELGEFLRRRLRQGDGIVLASFDGRLRLHAGVSRDWKRIEKALDMIGREPAPGNLAESEERRVTDEIAELAAPPWEEAGAVTARCPSRVGQIVSRHTSDAFARVQASVAGFTAFVAAVGALPGRKALVYLSDGIPSQPGAGLFEFLSGYCGGEAAGEDVYDVREGVREARRLFDTAELFRELGHQANARGVTLYTVEALGKRWDSGRGTLARRVEKVRWAGLRRSLTEMASATGGKAILGTTDLAPELAAVGVDLDTYYSFGYRPADSAVGDSEIGVRLRRPGLAVRHRRSLARLSLEHELAGRTHAAFLEGSVSNPLGVEVELGEIRRMDFIHVVPLQLRIPLDKLTLLPGMDGYRGRLRVLVSGRDREGHLAEVRQYPVPIVVPQAELGAPSTRDFAYVVPMLLREGEHQAAVCVHDDLGAVTSILTKDVHVSRSAR